MDIQEVFIAAAVSVVAMIALLTFMGSFNDKYDTTLGSSFNESMKSTQLLNNLTNLGNDIGETSQTEEGAGQDSQEASLIEQGRSAFTITTRLLGLIPSMITDGALMLGVPANYVQLARAVFLAVFGLTLAFILLLGVKRLVG